VQPVQPGGLGVEQVGAVALDGVVGTPQPPDGRAGGAVGRSAVDGRLDLGLDLVRQLVPAGGEQLDAVVRHRVVRGGEDDAEVGAVGGGQERDRGRGDDVDQQHVGPGRGEAGDDRRLQHLPAGPGITPHHRHRAVGGVVRDEHPGGRAGHGQRQLGRQLPVRQPANPVSTEEGAHYRLEY
jgi:hypothetical protein